MAQFILGNLTVGIATRRRVLRLDLRTLSERDLADLNLPAEVRSRVSGQRQCRILRQF
jgi:hypothetical protein